MDSGTSGLICNRGILVCSLKGYEDICTPSENIKGASNLTLPNPYQKVQLRQIFDKGGVSKCYVIFDIFGKSQIIICLVVISLLSAGSLGLS